MNSDFDVDITIPNNTLASTLLATTFYSKDILIQGVFYVDAPVAMYNCRVKLAAGAQIIVTSEVFRNDFLVFQTKFFSCTDMWKGIVLEPGVRCRLYSCKIEDAQYAITVQQGVSIALYGNVFNRNFVSITNGNENHQLPFLLFKNNTFNCTSALSDYFDLDFPCCDEDMVSFAGILLNNCSSSIGYYGSRNRFYNLN